MNRLSLIICGFLAAAAPIVAAAQFPTAVVPGARVRVVLPDSLPQKAMEPRQTMLYGNVRRATNDSLYLTLHRASGTIGIAREDIDRLAVSHGMQTRLQSAAEKGLGAALVVGTSFWLQWQFRDGEDRQFRNAGEAAWVGGLIGLGVGSVIGVIWPTERWRRLRLGR